MTLIHVARLVLESFTIKLLWKQNRAGGSLPTVKIIDPKFDSLWYLTGIRPLAGIPSSASTALNFSSKWSTSWIFRRNMGTYERAKKGKEKFKIFPDYARQHEDIVECLITFTGVPLITAPWCKVTMAVSVSGTTVIIFTSPRDSMSVTNSFQEMNLQSIP